MKKKLTVVKLGGSLLDPENFPKLTRALAPFFKKNPSLIVHGGGKEVTQLAERLALKTHFIDGRRVTDAALMDVVQMALSGKVNPYVVEQLRKSNVPAVGFSGRSADAVVARIVPKLGRVGVVQKVYPQFLRQVIAAGYLPVLSSVAQDKNRAPLNVNADEMASALAEGFKAQKLILFTDVPGILDAEKKTIPEITPPLARQLIRDQVITGGMIPKVKSALAALQKGVDEIWIWQGKLPLLQSRGTVLRRNHKTNNFPL